MGENILKFPLSQYYRLANFTEFYDKIADLTTLSRCHTHTHTLRTPTRSQIDLTLIYPMSDHT